MHIAWLGKRTPFCGNVTYSRNITEALRDRGHCLTFLRFDRSGKHSSDETDILLPYWHKSQIYTVPDPRAIAKLTRTLAQVKPDLVHASLTLSLLDYYLPEICYALDLPLVATFHPPFDRQIRTLKSNTQLLTYRLYAPFLARYDGTIVFSQAQRDLFMHLQVPEEKLAVIPNGVDVERYCPGKSEFKSYLQARRLFVYQGRIAEEKNLEALLEAWKRCNFAPSSKLVMVGDGPLRKGLSHHYGEEIGVIWLGFVPDEDKRIDILRAADGFILPSLVEGLSISLLEAMACGVACIATDAGADGEVISGAGVTLNTQHVMSQLQALLPLFHENPELTAALGEKARQRVIDRYTLCDNITQLEAFYQKVIP